MKLNVYKDFERYLFTKDLAETTVTNYCRTARLIEEYIRSNYGLNYDENLQDIKGYMISNWATSIMDLKVTTRAVYILNANTFLKFLYSMQYVSFDLSSALPPVPNVEKYKKLHPNEVIPKQGYTPQEIDSMFRSINPNTLNRCRTRAIIAMLVTTGLRVTELISLNVSDPFDSSGFMMVARKGTHGAKVKVAIPKETLKYIREYIASRISHGISAEPDDPLFVTKNGRRMDRHEVHKSLKTVQLNVGTHTGVHTYRHTALTQISKSSSPAVARDVAGQKSITVTNRYLHSTDDEIKEATDALVALLTQ